MADPFQIAAKQIGLTEGQQAAAIQDYLQTGGVNLDPQTTAWCAAFVNATLAQSGQQGTGSNMARSFENWGQSVDDPQKGDLAVFWRDDPNSGKGHVGFFDGYNDDGTIRVLGGNQSDSVSIQGYSPNQLIGFRRGEGSDMGGNALAAAPQAMPPSPMAGNSNQGGNALAPRQYGRPPMAPQNYGWNNFQLDPNDFMRPPRNQLSGGFV